MLKNNIRRFVIGLFFKCCPMTIIRRISRVIVNTVKLKVTPIGRIHILNEIIQVMPSLTDIYPATSIMNKSFIFSVVTSPEHSSPYRVKGMIPIAMFCASLFMKATTTLNAAISYAVDSYKFWFASTTTLAYGIILVGIRFHPSCKNGKSSVNRTNFNTLVRREIKQFKPIHINPLSIQTI